MIQQMRQELSDKKDARTSARSKLSSMSSKRTTTADAVAQDDADDEPALLELVKQEDDVFILRARPPLSPFQAFGISLASVKRKLAVS